MPDDVLIDAARIAAESENNPALAMLLKMLANRLEEIL
jgi:hypothetical protein